MAKWSDNPYMVAAVLGITLMTAIGFLIGPMADYQSRVNAPAAQMEENGNEPGTLPENNYIQGESPLTANEQLALAAENDVVFINAFHSGDTEQLKVLEQVPGNWNNRVYVNVANYSESAIATGYGVREEDTPVVLVIGSAGQRPEELVRELRDGEITEANINTAVCDVIRDWGDQAANCV